MTLTNTQLQTRLETLEAKKNELQTALNNLATKSQLNSSLFVRQKEIDDLQDEVDSLASQVSILQGQFSGSIATHTHTETEITDLGDYATSAHLHDDRYYTETETDVLLSSKVGTSHSHLESDITDLGAYSVTGHSHSETDISDLQNYSLSGHSHTESQISDLQSYSLDTHNHDGTYVSTSANETVSGEKTFVSDMTVSGNVDLADNNLTNVNAIQFTTSPTHVHVEGGVHWNDNDKTLNVDTEVEDTSIQVGQESVLRATNKTGVAITNGQVVYVNGAQGSRPTIALADADTEATSDRTVGICTNTIADNATGYITVFGLVRDINTTGSPEGEFWTAGDVLYISSTAGAMTNIQPVTPAHMVKAGVVVYAHATQGVILVDIDLGYELDEIHDVSVSGLQDGNGLSWNNSQSFWEPTDFTVSGHSHTESDVLDLGSYSTTGHTHTEVDVTDLQNYTVSGHSHTESDISDLGSYAPWAPFVTQKQPSGTTATHNFSNDNRNQTLDLGLASGDVTITLTNPENGRVYVIKVVQGSPARQLTWPASVLWAGGTAPTLTTDNDAIDLIQLFYDGTNYFGAFVQDYS